MMTSLTNQERTQILAALRHWQRTVEYAKARYPQHFRFDEPLTHDQIDLLCQVINCAHEVAIIEGGENEANL